MLTEKLPHTRSVRVSGGPNQIQKWPNLRRCQDGTDPDANRTRAGCESVPVCVQSVNGVAAARHARREGAVVGGELIFDNEELLPHWLRTVDGRLTLEVDLVVVDEMAFRGVQGPIVFTDRGFEVDVVATVGAGSIVIDIDHNYSGVETSIKVKGSDISLGVMRLTRDYIEDAPTSFEIDVVGEGTTERAFVSTMDGFIEAEVGQGKINNTEIDRLSQNIFALTFSSIVPFKKTVKRGVLECGAIRFDFDDGRAVTTHSVVMRSNRLVIVGRGVVDLKEETIDMHFKPHVRQGIRTKTGGAVSLISLTGPLDDPDVKIKAGGLLKEGVSLGAAFFTFGLSKAAEAVFDWSTRKDIACEIAVEN